MKRYVDLPNYRIEIEPDSHGTGSPYDPCLWVNFKIYKIVGYDQNWPVFSKNSCNDGIVDSFEKAEPFISGFTKWDGCTQWNALDTNTHLDLEELGEDDALADLEGYFAAIRTAVVEARKEIKS